MNNTDTNSIKNGSAFQQKIENYPAEIRSLRSYIPAQGKKPAMKKWNLSKNWKTLKQIRLNIFTAAFMMRTPDDVSEEEQRDYFIVDFDKVLSEPYNLDSFVTQEAKNWFDFINDVGTYGEFSKSGCGVHFVLRPSREKHFPSFHDAINLDSSQETKASKVKAEIFYRTNHPMTLTGNILTPTPAQIVSGKEADKVLIAFGTELNVQREKLYRQAVENTPTYSADDSPLSTSDELKRILSCIPVEELDEKDWWLVGAILESISHDNFNLWNDWSATDTRTGEYDEKNCRYQWDKMPEYRAHCHKPAGLGTLIWVAKRFGYKPPLRNKKEKTQDVEELKSRLEKLKAEKEPSAECLAEIQKIIRDLCVWSHDKNGYRTKIKSDVQNYKLVFDNDINLRGLFGRDNFRQETIFLKRAPWHDKNLQLKDTWDDSDDAELRLYLAENYAEMGTPQRTLDFVIRIARENSFHSIRNFFEDLPKWDGEPRAEKLFVKFLGAEDTQYTQKITMHLLFGAIARAFYPGCDFQSVVVLQGPQGIGKSRVLRMLGGKHGVNPKGDSWHIALRDQLDDSHAVDAMRKGWFVEIEEFAAASRADVNSMKGVLSADDVTRRFAYDRHAKTIKAHWVFVATCNDDAPLRDQTGNRRYLPIKCYHKESTIVEGMTPEYIRQVWAEAYHKFKKLFPTVDDFDADKLRLSPELQAQAARYADAITQDDGLKTEIKGFLARKIPPHAIWCLLTKDERRKFFVAGSITLLDCVADLNQRARAKYGRNAQSYVDELDRIFRSQDTIIRKSTIKRGDDNVDEYHIYGTEERQHICAAEIFNECFGNDNRKRMPRINEVLARLEGWHAGERLQKADPAYPDQKKPYYRN